MLAWTASVGAQATFGLCIIHPSGLWGDVVNQAELERAQQKFEDAVRTWLPGATIDSVELQQYGAASEVESVDLVGKIFIALPDGTDKTDAQVCKRAFTAFSREHREALAGLRRALGVTSFGGGLHDVIFPDVVPVSPRGPVVRMKMKADGLLAWVSSRQPDSDRG